MNKSFGICPDFPESKDIRKDWNRSPWISVKDQEPPKDKTFLAYVFFKIDKNKEIYICIWDNFYDRFIDYCCTYGDREYFEITHWMPLPEPPHD